MLVREAGGRLIGEVSGGGAPRGQNNRIIIYYHMFKAWRDNIIPGTVKTIAVWQVCSLTSQQLVAQHIFNRSVRLLARTAAGCWWPENRFGQVFVPAILPHKGD